MASVQLFNSSNRLKGFSPCPRSHAVPHSMSALNNAHIFTCLCTACNAIKFLNSSSGVSTKQDADERKWNYKRALAAGEGLCLTAALASQLSCILHPPKAVREHLAAAPCLQPPGKLTSVVVLPAWQLIPLWLALLFNVVLRASQGRAAAQSNGADSLGVLQRVVKVEEEVLSSVNVIRALTRQVEKLGVRVQLTRRALQEPIQQAATLAGSMCEAVKALSNREAMLEEEVKEMRGAMVAMQELQAKQVEVIAELVRKLKEERKSVEMVKKSGGGAPFIKADYKYDYWTTN